jgi:hypothetical protein
MLEELYVRGKLGELEDAALSERARLMSELAAERPRRRLKAALGSRLIAAGAWLERTGRSLVVGSAGEPDPAR